ncbi:tumor necrosis factor receptor superfamily member 5 isoform X2 [Amphiprion ocellaris]|uniref:tumor necrosis factor receptor superfamily member 5 isoform X2 n=1 Tax=Amphiprion ocellaris TaxID=80972 RepID=UPI000C3071CA|nr:tumor necrosis factor receptor superfamily member 5 isoform X2 [Amphiprion ocellaris]
MSLYLLLLMGAFMVLTTAQPPCDPQTQYEQDGQCCNMCGKGTSMTTFGTCEFPQCTECLDKEYQEGYTKERLCKRQPYCDPNLNFEVTIHHSKIAKTVCKCKEGFHCASADCKGCLRHKKCGPGQGAYPKGDHTHDTQCKECPEGTFSNETSWSSSCKTWTPCEEQFYTEEEGTPTSDRKCAPSRQHIILAIVVILAVFVVAAVIMIFFCKGRMREKAKPCIELCRGNEHQPLPDTGMKTPEENDAEQSLLEMSSEGPVTVRGNPVREEDGKSEIVSRQESQPDTCPSF